MRKTLLVAWILLAATVAFAQNQVATITSSDPFYLRGATITPGQGVPTWPGLAGDDVKAGNALTIVTFSDGSVVTLSPGSEGKIDLVNGKPEFKLLHGSADYSLKSTSAVELVACDRKVNPKALAGVLTDCGKSGAGAAGGGAWTAAHTAAVVLAVGGAAGLAVGIYESQVSNAPSVSPSQ